MKTIYSLPTIDPAAARHALETRFAHPEDDRMSPRQRMQAAVERRPSDRVPFDFWAVSEVIQALKDWLMVEDDEALLQLLGVDGRIVIPDYIGPTPETFPDGSFYDRNGFHRRLVQNEFSTYEEYASFPLADMTSRSAVESWPRWPQAEYWNWSGLVEQITSINQRVPYHIRFDVGGIFESAWGLYGFERFLTGLMENPEVPIAILNCITDLLISKVHHLMAAAPGLIDIVYTYDDVAIQNGLLMSPRTWRKFILPCHQRLNAVIKSYQLKILYHSCGAIYPLIPALITEMGIDVLNPLQPRAAMMDMPRIKAEFGGQVAFHGGIDLQETLPHGTMEDVTHEVQARCHILGAGGGYICTSAHYIQADVPLENILALYTAPRTAV